MKLRDAHGDVVDITIPFYAKSLSGSAFYRVDEAGTTIVKTYAHNKGISLESPETNGAALLKSNVEITAAEFAKEYISMMMYLGSLIQAKSCGDLPVLETLKKG